LTFARTWVFEAFEPFEVGDKSTLNNTNIIFDSQVSQLWV